MQKDACCGLILENKEGKILLQLRDDKKKIKYPNCWGTFGGWIKTSEKPLKAIKREIKEELGYKLKEPEYIGNFLFAGSDIHMFRKVDKKIKLKELKVNEGQEAKFFSKYYHVLICKRRKYH